MNRKDSRNLQIDLENCVKNVGNYRYNLILIAAERLRELKKQNRSGDKMITAIDALLDIQEGKIDPTEYLLKMDTKSQVIGK
jgi:DNA-directed RNA polymerase subunit K/omega